MKGEMKRSNELRSIARLAALAALVSGAACSAETDSRSAYVEIRAPAEPRTLAPQALPSFLSSHPEAVVIDVRTAEEFAAGLLYCSEGERSSRAARHLVTRGFQEVFFVSGGIEAWQANRLPTER